MAMFNCSSHWKLSGGNIYLTLGRATFLASLALSFQSGGGWKGYYISVLCGKIECWFLPLSATYCSYKPEQNVSQWHFDWSNHDHVMY